MCILYEWTARGLQRTLNCAHYPHLGPIEATVGIVNDAVKSIHMLLNRKKTGVSHTVTTVFRESHPGSGLPYRRNAENKSHHNYL